jgi:two-component system, OmpR family, sensor histidine kinase TctE
VGAWSFSRSLIPLDALTNELARRNPSKLEALPEPQLPELRPAVAALNKLFFELHEALERLKLQEAAAKRFAYGASHELRNPLSAIRNYLEVLKRAPNETRALTGAMREAERTETVLSGLLTLARLEGRGHVDGQDIDLTVFLEHLGVHVAAKPPECVVNAEPELLSLAINNILNNAKQHAQNDAPARLEKEDNGVWIWIDDTGTGFEPDVLPRAFESFVKTGNGTGLGLALVAAVTRVHRGKVRAENRMDGSRIAGASVGIWLPARASPQW